MASERAGRTGLPSISPRAAGRAAGLALALAIPLFFLSTTAEYVMLTSDPESTYEHAPAPWTPALLEAAPFLFDFASPGAVARAYGAIYPIVFALLALPILATDARQRDQMTGFLPTWSRRFLLGAIALTVAGGIVDYWLPPDWVPLHVLNIIGFLAFTAGCVPYGIATLRAHALPRSVGRAILAAGPLTILLLPLLPAVPGTPALVQTIAWTIVAAMLRNAPPQQVPHAIQANP